MGKVYSTLTRPIRNLNIETRAERLISREKPIPAPQYGATEKQKKLMDSVNPHFLEEHYQKNIQLDQRLKDVFVRSTDLQEIKGSVKESKPLPQNRQSFYDDFLFESCEYIPVGKCSLKQVFMFLMQHKRDPITYSSENIASEYKLDKKVVDDILKYFKLYIIVTPKDMTEKLEDPFQKMLELEMKKKDKEKKQ
ncbi:hypothetical protein P5V15_004493 [Pogonomyrmex californicus]